MNTLTLLIYIAAFILSAKLIRMIIKTYYEYGASSVLNLFIIIAPVIVVTTIIAFLAFLFSLT